jgi:hypothetical protein
MCIKMVFLSIFLMIFTKKWERRIKIASIKSYVPICAEIWPCSESQTNLKVWFLEQTLFVYYIFIQGLMQKPLIFLFFFKKSFLIRCFKNKPYFWAMLSRVRSLSSNMMIWGDYRFFLYRKGPLYRFTVLFKKIF